MSVLPALAALFVGIAALVAGQGLMNTTVSLQLEAGGTRGPILWGVLAAYYAGWIAGCLGVPRMLKGIGHIRTFAVLGATTCAATLLYTLVPPPFAWMVLRSVSGFCLAGLLLTTENWLTLHAPPERRGTVLSVYLVVIHVGLGGGQFALLLTGAAGSTPYVVAAVFLAMASVPVASTRSPVPSVPEPTWLEPRRLFGSARSAVLGAFVSGLMLASFQTLGPIYLGRLGYPSAEVALWMGVAIVSGLALQGPIGMLSDRLDRRILLLLVCLLIAATSGAFVFGVLSFVGLLVLGGLFGSLAALVYPLALAHGVDRVRPDEALGLGATLVMVAGIGSLVGPIVAGLSMSLLGPEGLFVFTGGAASLVALYSVRRVLTRDAPTAGQSTPYVAVRETAPAAAQLDPRVPEEEVELLGAAATEAGAETPEADNGSPS